MQKATVNDLASIIQLILVDC